MFSSRPIKTVWDTGVFGFYQYWTTTTTKTCLFQKLEKIFTTQTKKESSNILKEKQGHKITSNHTQVQKNNTTHVIGSKDHIIELNKGDMKEEEENIKGVKKEKYQR